MTDRIIPNALALPKIFHVARKSPAQESAGLKVVSRLIPRRADNRLVGTAPEPSFFGRQKSPARVAWPGPRDVSGICRANPDAPNLPQHYGGASPMPDRKFMALLGARGLAARR